MRLIRHTTALNVCKYDSDRRAQNLTSIKYESLLVCKDWQQEREGLGTRDGREQTQLRLLDWC